MRPEPLSLPGVVLIRPILRPDSRGVFHETFRADAYAAIGAGGPWAQENQSLSRASWTLRGLHWQEGPAAQAKLVRCVRGAILDVVLDVRPGSASFGRHVAARLTADAAEQIFIPEGFAHGFLTLEPDTVVAYKVSTYYEPGAEKGVRWNDPALAIEWGLPAGAHPILSPRDADLPTLAEIRGA